jgi:hypothetical protein
MGDEDNLNAVGIDSEFSHGDQRGGTTVNEKCPMAVLNIETSVEATPAAKRISRTQKSKVSSDSSRVPLAIRQLQSLTGHYGSAEGLAACH